jgi:hypothetical protein
MTDLHLLFLVLALIYLWECVVWVRRGSMVCLTWLGCRWRLRFPSSLLGNARGGFLIAPPLPPLGTLLHCMTPALAFAPGGFLAFTSSHLDPGPRFPQTGLRVDWSELTTIETRRAKVLVNGRLLVRCDSHAGALEVRRRLEILRRTTAGDRERGIEDLCRDAFDRQAFERRWIEFGKVTRPLAWVCNAYFLVLFGVAPALAFGLGLSSSWPILLFAGLTLATLTSTLFRRAHRTLYPEADDDRFTHGLVVFLSPPTAVRARDHLARSLAVSFHPLTLAMVFINDRDKRLFARRVLKELKFPARPTAPPGSAEATVMEASWRERQQKAAAMLLRQSGLDPAELLRPPAPQDESCRSYCPRCEAQFVKTGGVCRDCGGLPLVPLHSSSE